MSKKIKFKPDLVCKCGHLRLVHTPPLWFKEETDAWIPTACYKGPVSDGYMWPCECNEFVMDNLGYLKKKYEQRQPHK